MSPYLFVLCIDKLPHVINDVVETRKWDCIKVGRKGPKISHLMFVNDLLLFGKATETQVQCVMDILNTFCASSGQRISLEKSYILFSINTLTNIRRKVLHVSGLKETAELGTYLRVPLTGKVLILKSTIIC